MAEPDAPSLRKKIQKRKLFIIENFRHQLAYIDALPQLTLLGLISGIFVGLVIVAFRWLINTPLSHLLRGGNDNFESLGSLWHFGLPLAGACAIGLCLSRLDKKHHRVGVGHVLDRLHNHQGQLPLSNWLVQFFGGVVSLASGQSVGREGPAVHLGAGAASQLGQWLKLPNNSLRTLIGCGVAAAIAASFNTPMAGVVFAMEVVLMEYTITSFIPVILASVSGAAITQLVFGEGVTFNVTPVQTTTLLELPYIAASGIVIAACAAAFIRLHLAVQNIRTPSIAMRLGLAGLLTGSVAVLVPQIMGVGYDTVAAAMLGELSLTLLVSIVIAKLVVAATSTGLGMPGGVIGPALVIGACLGGALGLLGNIMVPAGTATPGIYVLLGMAGMMAAVVNAPLAALMAVLELTYNPNMIFPTMLVIVVACLVTRQVFRCDGIFVAALSAGGTSLASGPMYQALSRAGVRSVMDTRFGCSRQSLSLDEARQLLTDKPMWIVIEELGKEKYLLRAADLAGYLDNAPEEVLTLDKDIDLLAIPARRHQTVPIHQQASLYEALQLLQQGAETLYVERPNTPLTSPVMGIITSSTIDNYYR
ncbi:chloride channel protein [Exilibacterium tricleocarpae]|uniref:Chloride channel protein n=1 Tax=Exilibacterium tricleocarpae TaxID=2591008 RepID=A0A545T3B6_9GAMM|nr:chloride channel protein [Exilibacterium tricleocarpae]TQV71709.1 chloride channel protein [Exilibacterium tricleocarpae]